MVEQPPMCGKGFAHGPQTCKRRPPNHIGLHRDHPTVRGATLMWGDNETRNGGDRG